MAPVKCYNNWNRRKSDVEEKDDPYRKYFFICEGANTETWYFKMLVDKQKELGIHPSIDIRFLEKTAEDRDISFPRKLIAFAEKQKKNRDIGFDEETDRMIIVFDADIFEDRVTDLDGVIEIGEKDNILGVSNPAFELFLLLHYPDSYEKHIKPNETEIIANKKIENQRYIRRLFTRVSGKNPKKNDAVGELALLVDTAIAQERKINEDIHCCKGKITCNIGKIIDDIRHNRAI